MRLGEDLRKIRRAREICMCRRRLKGHETVVMKLMQMHHHYYRGRNRHLLEYVQRVFTGADPLLNHPRQASCLASHSLQTTTTEKCSSIQSGPANEKLQSRETHVEQNVYHTSAAFPHPPGLLQRTLYCTTQQPSRPSISFLFSLTSSSCLFFQA